MTDQPTPQPDPQPFRDEPLAAVWTALHDALGIAFEPTTVDEFIEALALRGFHVVRQGQAVHPDTGEVCEVEWPALDGGQGHGLVDVPYMLRSGVLLQLRRTNTESATELNVDRLYRLVPLAGVATPEDER